MKWILESTTPVNPKPNDPGLLTLSQYFQLRNKDDKFHDDAIYKVSLYDLNYKFVVPYYQRDKSQLIVVDGIKKQYIKVANHKEHDIKAAMLADDEYNRGGKIVATQHDGTWFYNPKYINDDNLKQLEPKGRYVIHKYPERVLEMAIEEYVKQSNKKKYNKPFKRMKLKGEYFTFHIDREWVDSIQVLNDDHLIVANASDEWGATLVQVAEEYAGKGIGQHLASMFIDMFQKPSGGYTPDGVKNAERIWNNRVSEYIQYGWYSELIKNNRIEREQVRKILSQYKSKKPTQEKIPTVTKSKDNDITYLCYIDEEDVTFVLYDARYLEEQNDAYIHGYTFLRDTEFEHDFVYTFEYDDDYSRKLLSYILLQVQKKKGTGVNINFVGGDLFEYVDLKDVKEHNGIVYLTKDKVDIEKIQRIEQQLRSKNDPYNEILYSLIEDAESKYD